MPRSDARGRSVARRALSVLATVLALPYTGLFVALRPLVGGDRAMKWVSEALSLVPDGIGTLMRRGFLAVALADLGADTTVSFGVIFSKCGARLGDRVYLGHRCSIGLADIAADVLVGDEVHILSGSNQHGFRDLDAPIREQPGRFDRVSIGQGSWIGSNAVVMADVGEHCVIGAGAVVTGPVPAYSIAAGNPCVVLRDRREPRT